MEKKIVGFTLIDGVFTTYDFPVQKTLSSLHSVIMGMLLDTTRIAMGAVPWGRLGKWRIAPNTIFPGAVQTEIYGISDATGALTGNFTDASGIRRGFSGDEIIEFPGALATYADFVNASGGMVGSYIDADGIYHPYVRTPTGRLSLSTFQEQHCWNTSLYTVSTMQILSLPEPN